MAVKKAKIEKILNVGHETNQLLSQNIKISFDTFKTGLGSMNTLVIGGTGVGKTRYYLKPLVYSLPVDPRKGEKRDKNGNIVYGKDNKPIMEYKKMSFVFTDPKGELCRDTAGILKANGYKIKIFNLIDMEHSDCYNPFKYAKDDTAITILIDGLVNTATEGASDKHWGEGAKNILTSIAFFMYYELPAEMQNFTTLSNLVPSFIMREEDTKAPYDQLLDIALKNSPLGDLHPAIVWRNKVSAPPKELGSIISTANDAIKLWAHIAVQKLTEVDTLNLDTIGDEPTAVYVITPVSNSTYDFLVATFYNQLFETLMYKANFVYHGGLPHHVLVVQDEFANTGKIPDYDKKIATFRSCNISSIIIVQSPNQIESMYKEKGQDIIDNTHIQIFLGSGGTGEKSAPEWESKALGKTTVKAESYSINYQKNEKDPIINSSIGDSERNLMNADEIKRLKKDECIITITQHKPFLDKKIDLDKCLNYSSDVFTYEKNNQRKLRKEFEYIIEDNKKTLDSYFEGKKELPYIDIQEYEELKKIIIRNSNFASFERDYGTNRLKLLKHDMVQERILINLNFISDYIKDIKKEKFIPSVYLSNTSIEDNNNYENDNIDNDIHEEEDEKPAKRKKILKENTNVTCEVDVQSAKQLLSMNVILKENANIDNIEKLQNFNEKYINKVGVFCTDGSKE